MPGLVMTILAALPTITTGVAHLWGFIREARGALQQSGEWTPEMEAQYQASVLSTSTDPAWRPDLN